MPRSVAQEQRYFTGLLEDAVELHPTLDMAFIISTKYPCSAITSGKNVTFEEYQAFSQLAQTIAQYGKPFDTDWTAMKLPNENECWPISIIVQGDIVMGAVAKPQTLLSSMPFALGYRKKICPWQSTAVPS